MNLSQLRRFFHSAHSGLSLCQSLDEVTIEQINFSRLNVIRQHAAIRFRLKGCRTEQSRQSRDRLAVLDAMDLRSKHVNSFI
jgi:hypothetical protein